MSETAKLNRGPAAAARVAAGPPGVPAGRKRDVPSAEVAVLVQAALLHLRHERLDEAENAFLGVTATNPDNLTAVLGLGVIAWRQARHGVALGFAERAVTLAPRSSANRGLLARVLRDSGRLTDAIEAFRTAMRLDSKDNQARLELAGVLADNGQLEEAARCYRTALRHDPAAATGHYNLGNVLARLGQGAEAVPCYEAALALDPEEPRYLNNLADALRRTGRVDEASRIYSGLSETDPESAEAHFNMGVALFQQERFAEAAAALQKALALEPDHVEALSSLGAALFEQRRHTEAEVHLRRAIALQPDQADARNNLGTVLRDLGQDLEAETSFMEALSLNPDHVSARYNLATTLLLAGAWREGFEAYEARWDTPMMKPRGFVQPQWRGENLRGRAVLLHAEQGLGDTLQFCRLVQEAASAHRVVLEVEPPLVPLLARSLPGVARVVARGQPLPAFDAQCPLLSLPVVLGTTVEAIAGPVPYLAPDPERVKHWRERLAELPGLRVGLVWRGNQKYAEMRRKRDLGAGMLPRLALPGVSFVSLQKGLKDETLASDLGGLTITDWTGELADFDETAALVAGLDLVIGVDTAVIHLAGGLGRPVWLLNRFDTCWRWLRGRDDSPWYPSLRQFRQNSLGDWSTVVDEVRTELTELARR